MAVPYHQRRKLLLALCCAILMYGFHYHVLKIADPSLGTECMFQEGGRKVQEVLLAVPEAPSTDKLLPECISLYHS